MLQHTCLFEMRRMPLLLEDWRSRRPEVLQERWNSRLLGYSPHRAQLWCYSSRSCVRKPLTTFTECFMPTSW